MKHIRRMNEVRYIGPGGEVDDNSTLQDKINYRINELSWIKDRLELNKDQMTEEDEKQLGEFINDLHLFINGFR